MQTYHILTGREMINQVNWLIVNKIKTNNKSMKSIKLGVVHGNFNIHFYQTIETYHLSVMVLKN
jgi:hypothetical protein